MFIAATGMKSNMWSTATFRITIAVYTHSPSAYSSLKDLSLLQLPCEKQVKKNINEQSTKCGIDEEAIKEEMKKLTNYVLQYLEGSDIQLQHYRPLLQLCKRPEIILFSDCVMRTLKVFSSYHF
ncbi:hypothetical protein OS493_006750 [Desmophyllum pertusum]|uniref:Uncharacterized protein n=1 Tax=Desmophyllum pertusum TaxID=174260 RepID=A0A9W9ZRV4_9CNID|nr:hypothetical protein OS493_006750 [Desmophyllum pertusum]